MNNPISDFVDAMRSAGIDTDYVPQGTGRIERFRVNGDKAGKKNGWCVLFLDGHPVGTFGNWKTGVSESWHADKLMNTTQAEREELSRKIEANKQKRAQEIRQTQLSAKKIANLLWSKAKPADPNHPYLVRKGIKPFGIKQLHQQLIVPRLINGEIVSIQYINADGSKYFLEGGEAIGAYLMFISVLKPRATGISTATLPDYTKTICICEGYATGASIFEATKYATVVAFNAGNLAPVAQAIRTKYPESKIILCADNDRWTDGNPGITKAREAAKLVGGYLSVAKFSVAKLLSLPSTIKPTDFNDVHTMDGLSSVKRIIDLAIRAL